MTLEELKAKKIHITLDKTITVGEDVDDDVLKYFLKDQVDKDASDKDTMSWFMELYYGASDIPDIIDFKDYHIEYE